MLAKIPFLKSKALLACLPALVLLVGPAANAAAEQPGAGKTIQQPGTVAAYEQIDVYARISGYVQKVAVDIGDRVKKDELLAELWAPELGDEVKQKKALVHQAAAGVEQARRSVVVSTAAQQIAKVRILDAEAGLKSAMVKLDLTKSKYDRLAKLAATGSVDKLTVDEARAEVEAAEAGRQQTAVKVKVAEALYEEATAKRDKVKADVNWAEAGLMAAEADLQRAATLLQYGQIRAPFDGIVIRRGADTGAFTGPPAGNLAKPLFTVARIDIVRIVVQVPEADVGLVTVGMPASVRIEALKGEEFKGKVTRLAGALDPKSRTMRVEIHLANPQGRLLPGMSATVSLFAAQAK